MSISRVGPKRLTKTLAALDAWWGEFGYPPSTRELTAAMGLKAYSSIYNVLEYAAAQGLILMMPTLVGKAYIPLWVWEAIKNARPKPD